MRISPINNVQTTNFESRLPNKKILNVLEEKKFARSDFWNELADECVKSNNGKRLEAALEKITQFPDKCVLMLQKFKAYKNGEIEEIYEFALFKEQKNSQKLIENIETNINVNKTVRISKESNYECSRTIGNNESDRVKGKLSDVLLDTVEQIARPYSRCHEAIYGTRNVQSPGDSIISKFRSK